MKKKEPKDSQECLEDPRIQLFAALACDARVEILKLLRKEEKCTCDLASRIQVDGSVVSRHLTILRSVGLIARRKEGVSNYYSIVDERIFGILDTASDILREMIERQQELFTQL